MTTVHVSIIVHKGSPLDYPRYRHTALWLQFADNSSPVIVNVVGPQGGFEFESRESQAPWNVEGYAKTVDVGQLTTSATSEQIRSVLRTVPIENHDREFQCQVWVEYALRMLRDDGYLRAELYDKGVNDMVDTIAEAEDVEE